MKSTFENDFFGCQGFFSREFWIKKWLKKELNDKNLKSCSLSSNRAFPKSISKPNDRHGHTDSVGVKTSTLKLKILRSENLNHYLHCGVRIHLLDLHKGYILQNQNPSSYPIRIWFHFENLKELNFYIFNPVRRLLQYFEAF